MEYMPSLTGRLVGFAYSAGLGFTLGIIYDLCRMFFYLLTGSDKKFSVIRDIIYLLVCLSATFIFLLVVSDGQFLMYIFLSEILGLALYSYSLSPLVYPPIKAVIRCLRRLIEGVISEILHIKTQIYKKTSKILHSRGLFSKKHLHIRHNIVYNFLRGTVFGGLILRNRGDESGKREKE